MTALRVLLMAMLIFAVSALGQAQKPFERPIQPWLRDGHTSGPVLQIEKFDPGFIVVRSIP